jgi:hypothetical protein
MDALNELVLRVTNFAPLWSTPDRSLLLLFVGNNIELFCCFAVTGIVVTLAMPVSSKTTLFGFNNRTFLSVVYATIITTIELCLVLSGVQQLPYMFLSVKFPVFLWLGYQQLILQSMYIADQPASKAVGISAAYTVRTICMLVGFFVVLPLLSQLGK